MERRPCMLQMLGAGLMDYIQNGCTAVEPWKGGLPVSNAKGLLR